MPGPIHLVQGTFAGGEFSPALTGRVDIAKYSTGLNKARNVIVMPSGGLRNRPGTKMVASAGDSTKQVRLIPFVAATNAAYIIELGNFYAKFYTQDAVVNLGAANAWVTLTSYVVGNFVTFGGQIYYCLVANSSGTFATDLAAGKWRAQTAYQIVTPWAAADIFALKFAQSADVMYFAHPSYAPQTLTFNSSASWTIAAYSFINGPFMLQNTTTTSTITPSALTGSITLTAASSIFSVGQIGGYFDLLWTIIGQTIAPNITTAPKNWLATGTTWAAVITGTWTGTILIQTSPDNITWTTVSTVTTNSSPSGNTGFAFGYIRAIMQSALAFTGSATVALTAVGTTAGPTAVGSLNAVTASAACGANATITITGIWNATVSLDKSTDGGTTWTSLATYTTNQAATVQATGETECLIRATTTVYTSGTPTVTISGSAPTLSVVVSSASVSSAIQCGQNWSAITLGSWTGKLRVEISTDGGNNWQLIQTFQSQGSNNFNTSGSTGVRQCLLRVSGDPTVAFSGTATIDLTSSSFDWEGVVKITAYASATSVTATVQNLSNTDSTGLANLTATWQWSEGSWSTYRGFPTCVSFFQDRLCWGATSAEPATGWMSQIGNYTDFGVSSPLVQSDAISFVLPSRKLNAIQNLVVMPQFMVALTSDSEWGISSSGGILAFDTIQQSLQGHRGSSSIDPTILGIELIIMQQMGTVVRNMIFQLAVNGIDGSNLSVISQHLFTGRTITQTAYQQEPESIVWFVRSDGKLLSLTYLREQEVQAFTWHDTNGLFESVTVIPNSTLGINELWLVVNRNGTRFIERMVARDQGIVPSSQYFVDCGLTYNSTPATVISGLSHLNGYSVSILADGNVVPRQVVSGGQITLDVAASVVQVGLPYVSDVETLRIEAPDNRGTLQNRRVAIPQVTLRFWNSRGGYLGPSDPGDDTTTGLDEIDQRNPEDPIQTAIPLRTQDYLQSMDGSYSQDAHIFFRQIDPLPFALLALVPQFVAGEN